MTDKHTQAQAGHSNMEKDPADWVTGDEPMTGAQRSYLKTLCEEAKEDFDEHLTKAQASRRIDELQQRTGRGRDGAGGSDASSRATDAALVGKIPIGIAEAAQPFVTEATSGFRPKCRFRLTCRVRKHLEWTSHAPTWLWRGPGRIQAMKIISLIHVMVAQAFYRWAMREINPLHPDLPRIMLRQQELADKARRMFAVSGYSR